jgi:beta-lactam-binding protein with PASTA domain
MRLRAARELLEQQGFKVGKLRYTYDNQRDGSIVLDQKPSAGAPAAGGTVVDLIVNED